ncbi:MAG TPA: hypothetical protein VJN18_22185 [Polyangiaceae bacterium]|nr:hypothetical protein [Polyangiaceae bacterium]
MGFPSRASEFPNDNSEISDGAIWICAELTGPAMVELAHCEPVESEPFVLMFDDEEEVVEGPVEILIEPGGIAVAVTQTETEVETEIEAVAEAETEEEAAAEAEAENDAGFGHFEATLVAVLLAKGATRSAALVPKLLRLEPLPAEGLSKDVQLTLQSRGYLDGGARYSAKFRELCGAWSAVLRGASQDFAACGTTTLDRFGAELLAALLAVPATRADELRRDLRKAGIAAFGVLQAA